MTSSFKFPFDFKSIQDSLPSVNQVKEQFTKTGDSFTKTIQPFTTKTTQLISEQLKQVQQLANISNDDNIDISELPKDYLQLENNCDLLLKLYTDLISFTNETYGKISYDYPPGNYTINKLKDTNVSGLINSKYQQLKNVSSPQELENILLGGGAGNENEDSGTVSIQPTSPEVSKTLFGHLSEVCQLHSEELKQLENPLSFALLQISSNYHEIGLSRLDQDKTIMNQLNSKLNEILNENFIKINELRKKVYSTRYEFDLIRNKFEKNDPENEKLIEKEDEFVNSIEIAVLEMKKLLKPSKNLNLLKIMIQAQQKYFEIGSKKLNDLLKNLDSIPINGEDEEEEEEEE